MDFAGCQIFSLSLRHPPIDLNKSVFVVDRGNNILHIQ